MGGIRCVHASLDGCFWNLIRSRSLVHEATRCPCYRWPTVVTGCLFGQRSPSHDVGRVPTSGLHKIIFLPPSMGVVRMVGRSGTFSTVVVDWTVVRKKIHPDA